MQDTDFLFTQFLSPVTNIRDDSYGGALENRARFLREAVSDVKKLFLFRCG